MNFKTAFALLFKRSLFFPIGLVGTFGIAQEPMPRQPLQGPGSPTYAHKAVKMSDYANRSDGYWLFEPADPVPDSAEVIVFMHGYGAYNPFAYGKWIKHLVGQGNIVIYPRYQRNLLFPRANRFPKNAAKGIRKAIERLQNEGQTKPKLNKVAYFGHSYGGVINSYLAVNWQKMGIPKPACMFLAQPGSGPLKGARLDDYSGMPSDLKMLIVVSERDYVVGSEFGKLVFVTAKNTPERNLIFQQQDYDGDRWIGATHSEPYCYDMDFDTGVRNYTAKRVLYTSKTNEVDFNCFWKLSDALVAYTREGKHKNIAFGNTPEQRYMGQWGNQKPIKELTVFEGNDFEEVNTEEKKMVRPKVEGKK